MSCDGKPLLDTANNIFEEIVLCDDETVSKIIEIISNENEELSDILRAKFF